MSGQGRHRALGMMSGTSLDGVDAALIETDGQRIFALGETAYRPYSEAEQAAIRFALGRWPGEAGVAGAAEAVETAHAMVAAGMEGDPIGFHGQTLAHDPDAGRTHQAGDGAVLAEVLGRTVVWDFRSADVALGGQGAPLAPFFHHALMRHAGMSAPVAVLNLGGVGNLSWIDPAIEAPEAEGAILAFDTGPANAPIDDLIRSRLGRRCDEGGALAAAGAVDEAVVARALAMPYFFRTPPKALDRNDFQEIADAVQPLSDADAAATLTAVAAASVAAGLVHCPRPPERLLVAGGGRRNLALMAMLAERIACPVQPVEEIGVDGDMLEAQAFGYLAVRVLRGLPTSAPSTTGVAAAIGGGIVSRPGGAGQRGISKPGGASSNPSN